MRPIKLRAGAASLKRLDPAVAQGAPAQILGAYETARAGRHLLAPLLPRSLKIKAWNHYPKDDSRDPETGFQYFYHAHDAEDARGAEHGHFHLFLPVEKLPRARPVRQSGLARGSTPSRLSQLTHLVGLSLDAQCLPLAFFTVNRWVTDETVIPATALIGGLDKFLPGPKRVTGRPIDAWLYGMLTLYRDDIARLLLARDRQIAAFKTKFPRRDVYEARELEVPSILPVDLPGRIAALEALKRRPARPKRP